MNVSDQLADHTNVLQGNASGQYRHSAFGVMGGMAGMRSVMLQHRRGPATSSGTSLRQLLRTMMQVVKASAVASTHTGDLCMTYACPLTRLMKTFITSNCH